MNIAVFDAESKLSARLVPMNAPAAQDRARAVRAVRALNKRLNIDAGISLRKLIDTGRD